MNHILLFENYDKSEDNYQRISFSRSEIGTTFPKTIINPTAVNPPGGKDLVDLGLVDGTIPVEDYWIEEVIIEYNIQPVFGKYGIDEISLNLKKVHIIGNYEIAAGDNDTDSYDFDITDNGPFDGRVDIEVGKLPFSPTTIEIDLTQLDEFYPGQISDLIKYDVAIGQ